MSAPDYKQLLETEINYLRAIPLQGVDTFAEAIATRSPHAKVITSGMGKAGQIAHTLATTLSSTGTPACFLHPAEAQHGDLGIMSNGDVLILFSNSGKTREVLELRQLVLNLFPGTIILSITGYPDSELAINSACNIAYGPVEEICPLKLTPTTSTTCMSVISDLIVVSVMHKTGFTKQQYAQRHHGGYNGERSKK